MPRDASDVTVGDIVNRDDRVDCVDGGRVDTVEESVNKVDTVVLRDGADAELGDTLVCDNPMDHVGGRVDAEEGVGKINAALPLFGVDAAAMGFGSC